jgi:hypothetical protein
MHVALASLLPHAAEKGIHLEGIIVSADYPHMGLYMRKFRFKYSYVHMCAFANDAGTRTQPPPLPRRGLEPKLGVVLGYHISHTQ